MSVELIEDLELGDLSSSVTVSKAPKGGIYFVSNDGGRSYVYFMQTLGIF